MTVVAARPKNPAAQPSDRSFLATRVGAVVGLATAAAYFAGPGRALDYDGSVTVGLFVKHGSLLDVFRSAYAFNNQPYFSFVEHIVYDLGGHSESWLRVAPIVAAAAVVGILAAWSTARWGLAAGIVAGTVLAANPMFASLSRSVRGYSLMVLGCTVATLIFTDARERPTSMTGRRSVVYVAALGIAIGTQMYAVVVLGAHLAVLASDRRLDREWRRRILGVGVVGALPYIGMVNQLRATAHDRKGTFLRSFPVDAAREVLGHELVAVAVFGTCAVLALARVGWRRGLAPAIAAITIALFALWVVMHPLDLYPRFVVWLVPAVALAAAFTVSRRQSITFVVAFAVVAMMLVQAGSWTSDPIASRQVAHIVEQARADGRVPCATGSNGEVLAGYTAAVRAVNTVNQIERCDLIFGMPQTSQTLPAQIACHFRTHAWLVGTVNILVLSHPNPGRPTIC